MGNIMKWLVQSIEDNIKIDMRDVVSNLGERYPLFHEFKNTPQDPEWHAEGDVYIHTDMVISETYKLFEENEFTNEEKLILLLAAIFHDICKPMVTKERELQGVNRVIAPKHEEMGISYLYYRFMEEDLDEYVKVHVLDLVGYHQKPKLLVIKNKSEWHYKYLTRHTAGYLFYYHQIADMKGRECSDKELQLSYLEEFKMFCDEYNCFKTTSCIIGELSMLLRANFKFNGEDDLKYVIYKCIYDLINDEYDEPIVAYQKYYEQKDDYSNAIILCGLSGSGKSTYTKELLKTMDCTIISLDEIRKGFKINNTNRKAVDGQVLQIATKQFKECMAKNQNVVWDACNIRKDFRSKLISLAHQYNALTTVVLVSTSINDCVENDKGRTDGHLGKEIILDQLDKFQFPEFHESNLHTVYAR